ncbi:MAG: site-specific integrase [Betaproteobacteria bacterium]
MATFTKRKDGYLFQVRRNGVSQSRTFGTKLEGQVWANQLETDIISGRHGRVPDIPVADLLARYAREVSPTHRGQKWELNRLALIGRDPLAQVRLRLLDQKHIAEWRIRRLAGHENDQGKKVPGVSNASVNREWNLLSGVFTTAMNEWRLLERHPMKGVKRPPKGAERDRLPSDAEIERLRLVMGDHGRTIVSKVFVAFLFAIETGMRLGEIVGLDSAASVKGPVALLTKTKNGDDRKVPLSAEAQRLWKAHGPFGVTAQQIDIHFRKSRTKAGIVDLHFHDSRHLAVTRLAKKLDVLELARMIGHRNLKQLMTYYNPSAEDLADKLNNLKEAA